MFVPREASIRGLAYTYYIQLNKHQFTQVWLLIVKLPVSVEGRVYGLRWEITCVLLAISSRDLLCCS